jgi:uncharacterized protein (TIGR02284 family)
MKDLLAACRQCVECFRSASEWARSAELKQLFDIYADQRRQFAQELENQMERHGGGPVRSEAHEGRNWMEIRIAITFSDDDQIIVDCERNENAAMRKYEEALQGDLSNDVRTVLLKHYSRIRQTRDRIRSLERPLAYPLACSQ